MSCTQNYNTLVYYMFSNVMLLITRNIFIPTEFFQNHLFFQEYHQSGKQFGSRSGPTFGRA